MGETSGEEEGNEKVTNNKQTRKFGQDEVACVLSVFARDGTAGWRIYSISKDIYNNFHPFVPSLLSFHLIRNYLPHRLTL